MADLNLTIYSLWSLAVVTIYLLLGWWVYRTIPRWTLQAKRFLLFCLLHATYTGALMLQFMWFSHEPTQDPVPVPFHILIASNISSFVGSFVLVSYSDFLLTLAERRPKQYLGAYVLALVAGIIFVHWEQKNSGQWFVGTGHYYPPALESAPELIGIFYASIITLSMVALWRAQSVTDSPIQRKILSQLFWISLIVVPAAVSDMMFTVKNRGIFPFSLVVAPALAIYFFYVIDRYRFLGGRVRRRDQDSLQQFLNRMMNEVDINKLMEELEIWLKYNIGLEDVEIFLRELPNSHSDCDFILDKHNDGMPTKKIAGDSLTIKRFLWEQKPIFRADLQLHQQLYPEHQELLKEFRRLDAEVCVPMFLTDQGLELVRAITNLDGTKNGTERKLLGVIVCGRKEGGKKSGKFKEKDRILLGMAAARLSSVFDRAELIRELESVHQFKWDLIRRLSHELNTPLTPIKLIVNTLGARLCKQTEDAEAIKIVLQEVTRLENLLRDLDSIANNKALPIPDKVTDFDMESVVDEVVTLFAFQAEERNIELNHQIASQTFYVLGNRERLKQALINLVDNSLKYTLPGGQVEIYAEQNDTSIEICVRDTGIGMSQSETTAIFQPFYRSEAVQLMKTDGVGLGLPIVKQIIEEHAGIINVNSTRGKGTEICLSLPKNR